MRRPVLPCSTDCHYATASAMWTSSHGFRVARSLLATVPHRSLAGAARMPSVATPFRVSVGHRSHEDKSSGGKRGWLGRATAVGTAVGTGVALSSIAACEEAPTSVSPSKKTSVVLYQYNPCPFCNKVKAYLDYSRLPWSAVEVDPLFKKEMKETGFKKVPVVFVVTEYDHVKVEQYLADSDSIIDHLRSAVSTSGDPHLREPFVSRDGTPEAAKEKQWREWVNGRFVHIVTANIYNTWGESVQTFDYLLTHGNFGKVNQLMSTYVGAVVMFALSKLKLNKKHGIVEPRAELYADCDAWVNAVGDHRFLGNDERPTLADLGVFGVLRAIRDYDTFADIMANTKIASWYFRVAEAVGESSRTDA